MQKISFFNNVAIGYNEVQWAPLRIHCTTTINSLLQQYYNINKTIVVDQQSSSNEHTLLALDLQII